MLTDPLENVNKSNFNVIYSLQAEVTIMKLTEERSMTTREKNMLKHELVSNLFHESFFLLSSLEDSRTSCKCSIYSLP